MSSVKICGLQHPDMVKSILHLPIDFIGFVFAPSKRRVTSAQAREMIQVLEAQRAAGLHTPLSVGVFVNPTTDELEAIMSDAALDVIQLHGQESPEECRWVKEHFPGVQVWKVVSVIQGYSSHETERLSTEDPSIEFNSVVAAFLNPYKGFVDGILLDTFDPVYGGGSGKPFAWDAIPPYQEWCRSAGIKLLVAGGLQPDNVEELLSAFTPDGVDVSSGVETDGVKDVLKITRFVERVKHHAKHTG
jgi:phosphoribosylanthranilate isomerase